MKTFEETAINFINWWSEEKKRRGIEFDNTSGKFYSINNR